MALAGSPIQEKRTHRHEMAAVRERTEKRDAETREARRKNPGKPRPDRDDTAARAVKDNMAATAEAVREHAPPNPPEARPLRDYRD